MKLLRLTSNNNNGVVDVNFNEDIRIESDSKISLLNTSFSVNKKEFLVSINNRQLIYNDSKWIVTTNSSGTFIPNKEHFDLFLIMPIMPMMLCIFV